MAAGTPQVSAAEGRLGGEPAWPGSPEGMGIPLLLQGARPVGLGVLLRVPPLLFGGLLRVPAEKSRLRAPLGAPCPLGRAGGQRGLPPSRPLWGGRVGAPKNVPQDICP